MTGFFLPVPAISGGATEKIWHGLAGTFASAGNSVTLVSRSWPNLAREETLNGVRNVRLPGFDHSRHLPLNLLFDLIWGIRVARALPRGDVVICNTVILPVWLHRLKPSAGRVVVMIGRAPKGQVRFYGGTARVYAPSTIVARKITSELPSARTLVTGYPIDWPMLARSAKQAAPPVTVGYVGRLHPEKGVALLVKAAGRLVGRPNLPEWRLKILGPASVKQGGGGEDWVCSLKSEAAAALGPRIEWLAPEFDQEKLAHEYGGLDIFCYPSLAKNGETFGVSVAEAMAARCAVVVSALDCFGDLVNDGQTGLVFAHDSADAERQLAECIGRLIADVGLRNDLALRGQQHVRRFDYAEVSKLILEDLAFLTGAGEEKRRESPDA